jgi:hypothetical protein
LIEYFELTQVYDCGGRRSLGTSIFLLEYELGFAPRSISHTGSSKTERGCDPI